MTPTSGISVVDPIPVYASFPRLLTAADLAALPSELPTGPVLYELDNGRLIVMPPAGDSHGATETKFTARLFYEGELKGHGVTRCGEVGIVLWKNPDRVVGADIAFITTDSLPIQLSPEGYLETIPQLIVEVRSKNDTTPAIERKITDYFKAGVKVVVVPDPAKKNVTVYRPGQTPVVLTVADVLTIEDLIPGLRMPVVEMFT